MTDGGFESRAIERRRSRRRLIILAVSIGLALIILAAAIISSEQVTGTPYSMISPNATFAEDIQELWELIFWMAAVVFIGVQALIVYTALRFKRRPNVTGRPPQVHGHRTLEIAWTIIPALILLVILIPTIQTMYETDAEAEEGDIVVDVYGKQWWWEIHYEGLAADGGPLVTANELLLPVGREVVFRLHSNNVIHSFWVPQLAGKQDVIPGHVTRLSFTPWETGDFYGECAEFCGIQHAWMRFEIDVVEEEQFDAWVAAWNTAPIFDANPETADVAEPPASFGLCITCHAINGATPPDIVQEGIMANPFSVNAGPNLTLLGCRDFLAAGVLVNTPENLDTWLDDPGDVKEGNYMAIAVEDDTLSEEQIAELVDYLESLKPEGGCPQDTVPALAEQESEAGDA
ncbi:MAG TPA: cytochrome c oxidase subunit II [Thermomicrobiales bacterium]|nr:cytochrome c oxidase subunit II [Thermomicrobiales bacterium]